MDQVVTDYLNELFDVDNINYISPLEYDDYTDEEWEDEDRLEFYLGDYDDENACFKWYSCDYFDEPPKDCPEVVLETEYSNQLDGYFGDKWHEPFKKWIYEHFDLKVNGVS